MMQLQTQLQDELAARKIILNPSQPVGDYAIHLACAAFDLQREPPATSGYDASDSEGLRYQVKFRRLAHAQDTRQLNAIKGIEQRKFDFLIGVLFNADMSIFRAVMMSFEVAASKVDKEKILLLSNKVLDAEGVFDVSDKFKAAQQL
ncbi:MAG TPA: hypothetical protein VGD95_05390 [Micavibrio sp.]